MDWAVYVVILAFSVVALFLMFALVWEHHKWIKIIRREEELRENEWRDSYNRMKFIEPPSLMKEWEEAHRKLTEHGKER